jgi:hypothetical protein
MTIGPNTTLPEFAFIVCTALPEAGTIAVLSGGGAATVYAPDAYQSRDLDFVLGFWSALAGEPEAPLTQLGFQGIGGTYHHPLTQFTVEFPAGPLAVGNETITHWSTLHEGARVLHILSPTDCVRDRLAWFMFSNDYSALDQALAVAKRHPVDLVAVRQWCKVEGELKKYEVFESRLRQ